jgi:WD domain, G-beta repeat
MTALTLRKIWGDPQGRLPKELATVALTDDPSVAYVLGNLDGRGLLRVLDPRTGATLREHTLPRLTVVRERVVVSSVRADGTMLLLATNDGVSAAWCLSLDSGFVTRLFDATSEYVDRLDDGRVMLERCVVVDGVTGAPVTNDARSWRSRDGRMRVTEALEGYLRVRPTAYDAKTDTTKRLRLARSGAVQYAFDRDGAWFARMVRIWSTGLEMCGIERLGLAGLRSVDYSGWLPSTAVIAATRGDGLTLVDLGAYGQGGAEVADDALSPYDPEAHAGPGWTPHASCVSPDGTRYGYARNGVLHVVDLVRGAELTGCDLHADAVRSIALSPDASCAITGGADGVITVWDVPANELRWRIESGGAVRAVALSPDGARVYATVDTRDGDDWASNLRVWELAEGSEITPAAMAFPYGSVVVVSPDGAGALLTCDVACVKPPAWVDLSNWRAHPYTWRDVSQRDRYNRALMVSRATFADDGATATLHWGHTFEHWRSTIDARTGEVRSVASRSERMIPEIVSRGATLRATVDAKGLLSVHHGDAMEPAVTARESPVPITAATLSRDEKWLFAGTSDGRVFIYGVQSTAPTEPAPVVTKKKRATRGRAVRS